MSDKCKQIWEEIKEYVITNNETCEIELKSDVPIEIQKKFEYWKNMDDDTISNLNIKNDEQSTQK